MNKKLIILIAIAAVLILIVLGYFVYRPAKIENGTIESPGKTEETAQSKTYEPAPENIVIPELGEETEKDVAAPTSVVAAAPGVEIKKRSFEIKGENDKFVPSTIIVKKGDIVRINFTAIDKTYDLTVPDYGLKQTAITGETKPVEFQAVNEGKYTYYCELCGGLDSTAVGYIIVAP